MKKLFKRRITTLILALAMALSLTACSNSNKEDNSFFTPEVPEVKVESFEGGSVSLPDTFEMPVEAGKMGVGIADGKLFGGFNIVTYVSTDYFTTGGSLNLSFNASLFQLSEEVYKPKETKYKDVAASLWEKDGDFAQYIGTATFLANGTTQYADFTDLDPTAEYRISFTYTEVPRVRMTGTFSAFGVTTQATATDDSSSSTAKK